MTNAPSAGAAVCSFSANCWRKDSICMAMFLFDPGNDRLALFQSPLFLTEFGLQQCQLRLVFGAHALGIAAGAAFRLDGV